MWLWGPRGRSLYADLIRSQHVQIWSHRSRAFLVQVSRAQNSALFYSSSAETWQDHTFSSTSRSVADINENDPNRAAKVKVSISCLSHRVHSSGACGKFEKVVLRWGGPLTMISLVSPELYLLSRMVMIDSVIAAFRASDPAVYDTYVVSTYWVHIL